MFRSVSGVHMIIAGSASWESYFLDKLAQSKAGGYILVEGD